MPSQFEEGPKPTPKEIGIKGQEIDLEGEKFEEEKADVLPEKPTWFIHDDFDIIEAEVRRESGKEEEISPEELKEIEAELERDRIFAKKMAKDETSGILRKLAKFTPAPVRELVLRVGIGALLLGTSLAAGGCVPEKPKEKIVQVMTAEQKEAEKVRAEKLRNLLDEAERAKDWQEGWGWGEKPEFLDSHYLKEAEDIAETSYEFTVIGYRYIDQENIQGAERVFRQSIEKTTDSKELFNIYKTLFDLTKDYGIDMEIFGEIEEKIRELTREQKSFEDLMNLSEKWEDVSSYREAGRYFKKAKKVLDKEIKEALKSKNADLLKSAQEKLIKFKKKLRGGEEIEKYHQLELQLRDEIWAIEGR